MSAAVSALRPTTACAPLRLHTAAPVWTAQVYANATRATILSLFGNDGVRLQSRLAEWWAEEMQAVSDGKLPDFIVQEIKDKRDARRSLQVVPAQGSLAAAAPSPGRRDVEVGR